MKHLRTRIAWLVLFCAISYAMVAAVPALVSPHQAVTAAALIADFGISPPHP